MKKGLIRVISWLLAVALLASMSVMVLADEPVSPKKVVSEPVDAVVATDGARYYEDYDETSAEKGTLEKGKVLKISEQWEFNGSTWGKVEDDDLGTVFINMDDVKVEEKKSDSGDNDDKDDGGDDDTTFTVKTGTITGASSVNVRQWHNAGSKKVGTVKEGDKVTVYAVSDDGKWARISAEEDQWIFASYIQLESDGDSSSDSTATDTTEKGTPKATGVVSSAINLNVRKKAGISEKLVKTLPTGTKVNIYETTTVKGVEWGQIGKDQWVCMTYVKLDGSSSESGSSSSGSTAATGTNATVVNCSTGVNVRDDASIKGKIVGRINLNGRVKITEVKTASNGSQWGKSADGWICMDYIKMDSTSEVSEDGKVDSTVTTTTGAPYANITVPAKVNEGGATVYLNADTESKELITIGKGQSIKITGRALVKNVQWGKVTISGNTGWIEMSHVTLDKVSATVSSAQLTVYSEPKTASDVKVIWGKGQKMTIITSETDGTYLWGQVGTNQWVNMSGVAITTGSNSGTSSGSSISISATVKESAQVLNDKDEMVVTLVKGTKITVTELKEKSGNCCGKVTVDSYTGWVDISKVAQTAVKAVASSNGVVLYSVADTTKPSSKTLNKGDSVTILERTKKNSIIWGKLLSNGVYYWVKMDQMSMSGISAGTSSSTSGTGTSASASGTSATASSGTVGTVVNTDKLNVRSAAGTSNKLVTTLKRGASVTVYEQTTKDGALWGRIDQGWVAMSYIDLSTKSTSTTSSVTGGTSTSSTTIMTTVPSGAIAVGFVNYVSEVNIRSGAGQGYSKVGTLKKGANVVIYEQKLVGGMIWGRIDKGWICTSYVTTTGTSVTGSGTTGTIARCFFTANVRNGAGVGNALVGKIMVNSRVEILETTTYSGEQWGRTSLGWINMNYVLLDGSAA